jgi:hypothetical protein
MTDSIQICPTCETRFIDGVHYWSGTGKKGSPLDLAGLVCNNIKNGKVCINPCKGMEGGQSWESRAGNLDAVLNEHGLLTKDTVPEML